MTMKQIKHPIKDGPKPIVDRAELEKDQSTLSNAFLDREKAKQRLPAHQKKNKRKPHHEGKQHFHQ